jgi:predicted lipid-binding transport protein (Tim44 family)
VYNSAAVAEPRVYSATDLSAACGGFVVGNLIGRYMLLSLLLQQTFLLILLLLALLLIKISAASRCFANASAASIAMKAEAKGHYFCRHHILQNHSML